MNTALFLQKISDSEGPLWTMAQDTLDFMSRPDFNDLCADMKRLVELDEEVKELGAKMGLRIKDLPVTDNHEAWKTCPVCGHDYDLRQDNECPECISEHVLELAPGGIFQSTNKDFQ